MASLNPSICDITSPGVESAALIATTLSQGGVPAALWGLHAAVLYGGELVPLDIELIVNDADQERVFTILTSNGLLPSVPDNEKSSRSPSMGFTDWRRQYSSSSQYRDRRRRHDAPIYEFRPRSTDLNSRIFVILYSAEFAGLAPVSGQDYRTQDTRFTSLSLLPKAIAICRVPTEMRNCLVPTFQSLVESEMHVLLQDTEFKSASWATHMAQLSALARSGCCHQGMDGLSEIVSPRFDPFVGWIRQSRRGRQDYSALKQLQSDYNGSGGKSPSLFSGLMDWVVSIKSRMICHRSPTV